MLVTALRFQQVSVLGGGGLITPIIAAVVFLSKSMEYKPIKTIGYRIMIGRGYTWIGMRKIVLLSL